MRLGFFGAAGEVTGSCTLVEADGLRFMVDCGMFQGGTEARGKNQRALRFGCDVRRIDFVLLTHAHIDHSGLLPRLAMLGYRSPVYATPSTIDLLHILLPDSAHIQEKGAEWHLRNRHRRGMDPRAIPAPLYSVEQALATLCLLRPVRYGRNPASGQRCDRPFSRCRPYPRLGLAGSPCRQRGPAPPPGFLRRPRPARPAGVARPAAAGRRG